MTITEFLNARYDEEERRAGMYHKLAEEFGSVVGLPTPHQTELPIALAAQVAIARTSSRILADIAAKRAIVEQHRPATAEDTHEIGAHPINDGRCSSCVALHDERGYCEQMEYPCPTTLALLQPHAEHPDFDESWKP